jgi:hypothetical protein
MFRWSDDHHQGAFWCWLKSLMMIIWSSKHVGVILSLLVCDSWINAVLQTSALVGPLYTVSGVYIPEYRNGENQTYIVYIRHTEKKSTVTLWLALSHSERNVAKMRLLPCLSILPPLCSLNVLSQECILESFITIFPRFPVLYKNIPQNSGHGKLSSTCALWAYRALTR